MKKYNKSLKALLAVTATAAIVAPSAQPFADLTVSPVQAASAEQKQSSEKPYTVKKPTSVEKSNTGEYIVTFAPHENDTKSKNYTEHIKGYVKAFGGEVVKEGQAIHYMTVKLPNEKVATALLNKKEITSIAPNNEIKVKYETMPSGWSTNNVNTPQGTKWGHDEIINEMKASGINATGKGVEVLVLDVGATDDHPDMPFVNIDKSIDEDNSGWEKPHMGDHAMGVAGVIGSKDNGIGTKGIAPDSRVFYYQVAQDYPANGGYQVVQFAGSTVGALDYAVVNGMDVVNMSYGAKEEYIPELGETMSAYHSATDVAVQEAYSKGLIMVAAAGNDNDLNDPSDDGTTQFDGHYPSDYHGVISVSAMNSNHQKSYYSNYGSVDFTAPDGAATTANPTAFPGEYYMQNFIGTSATAPVATGVIALYKELYPELNPYDLMDMVYSDAKWMSSMTFDQQGFGRISAPTHDSGVREDDLTHGGALYVAKNASGFSYGSGLKLYARLMDDPNVVPYKVGQHVRGWEKPFEGATIRHEIRNSAGQTTYTSAIKAATNGRYDLTIPVNTTNFPAKGSYTVYTRYSFTDPVTGQYLYSYKTQSISIN